MVDGGAGAESSLHPTADDTVAGGPSEEPGYQDVHAEDTGSGVLRAAVFGASDGLVSNLGVVAGVAAATPARSPVIIAGVAALVAGAFSMAAGEYVSMRTQREVLERELRIESEHIAEHPAEERDHLARLLAEHGGLEDAAAMAVAEQVHQEEDAALAFHARFELGIDPTSLGSPARASIGSFFAFVAGAIIPLLPFFFTTATTGLVAAVAASALGLAALGGLMTRFTGQRLWFGAVRQLGIGALAAGFTYGVGYLVGMMTGERPSL